MENSNWPEYIQAFTSIAALVLSLTTFIQGIKIKTLTDVTETLTQQNKILIETLEFKKILAIAEVQPVFSIGKENVLPGNRTVSVDLVNVGLDALSVKVTDPNNIPLLRVNWQEINTLKNGAKERLIVEWLADSEGTVKTGDFTLNVSFEDRRNGKYIQVLGFKDYKFYLTKPETIVEDPDRNSFTTIAL